MQRTYVPISTVLFNKFYRFILNRKNINTLHVLTDIPTPTTEPTTTSTVPVPTTVDLGK